VVFICEFRTVEVDSIRDTLCLLVRYEIVWSGRYIAKWLRESSRRNLLCCWQKASERYYKLNRHSHTRYLIYNLLKRILQLSLFRRTYLPLIVRERTHLNEDSLLVCIETCLNYGVEASLFGVFI